MKYISIDVETSGLNPDESQILEFGAVFEDTGNIRPLEELPRFHCYIKNEDNVITGNPYALAMNVDIIKKISEDGDNVLFDYDVPGRFAKWLIEVCGYKSESQYHNVVKINAAGKNFANFDLRFLRRLYNWESSIMVRSRIIDPAFYSTDWLNDESMPTLSTCLKRNGFDAHVAHTAIEDALDVIKLLRLQYTPA